MNVRIYQTHDSVDGGGGAGGFVSMIMDGFSLCLLLAWVSYLPIGETLIFALKSTGYWKSFFGRLLVKVLDWNKNLIMSCYYE